MEKGNKIARIVAVSFLLLALSCKKEKQLFEQLDFGESGITFQNTLNPTKDFNIIDYIYFYNGGGVAAGDINNDGLPDLYFSGNQVKNRLYLNKGNLKFEDITDQAGVAGTSSWKTGSVMADVNGDGLLDIYVCAVVGLKNLQGHNELFINNGDNTFSERSAEFGLDFESYSSSAAFLDFDLDGDLDIYLLNHAVHTSGSFGHANLRNVRTYESGGKLLRNDGNTFVDVSDHAGIYGGINGYGLGVAVSDFNLDGFPDIYVGNDFHEDDYLYINNTNGTFSEVGKQSLSCTSKFSMGNDVADINHDGLPDIISLDMLPEDEKVIKRSVDDENLPILKTRTDKYGYNYQFPRNALQVNQGNGQFAETALMSHVAATDWSWSALFADLDQDGNQDLFVSNGIPRRPNDLDYIKYISSKEVVDVIGSSKLVDEKALSLMPEGATKNCVFKGDGNLTFQNKSSEWLPDEKNCSTATALADLDLDGDLDIIVNNVNDKPTLYINQTGQASHYLKIRLNFGEKNAYGIGSRVYAYDSGRMQMKEMYVARGFQASSEPIMHFGFGQANAVDSLVVVWPDGSADVLQNVKVNQMLVTKPSATRAKYRSATKANDTLFHAIDPSSIALAHRHVEDAYSDFDRLKLLPYQQSDRGPATATGDINNDGLMDIYFGGSKHTRGKFFIQTSTGFKEETYASVQKDSIKEDVDAVIADFNDDGKSDLFIATGGADFFGNARPLLDSYYQNNGTGFTLQEIEGSFENASCVKAFDFDNDADLDLFIGNESVSNNFGQLPSSVLLRNDAGKFQSIQSEVFSALGMVTDGLWNDYDDDGDADLIVVGEWTSPVFLRNTNGQFQRDKVLQESLAGLWQSVSAFDADADGDTDFVLGNWGMNSRYSASADHPLRMYYGDLDDNGQSETVVAIEKHGAYYPLDGLDLIASQINGLRKKYQTYESFAGQTIEQVFGDKLSTCKMFEVAELASGYLRNDNGKYVFVPLPLITQVAPIMAQLVYDFDKDGKEDLLLAGNYFGVQPFHGRYGSFNGALINGKGEVISGNQLGLDFFKCSIRQLNILKFKGENYLLVTPNNDWIKLYKF